MTISTLLDFDLIRSLEERAFNAWPARKTTLCDGWLLRLSDGYTKRANSANALPPAAPFAKTLQVVESFHARHSLAAIFCLSPLAGQECDQVLDRAGYQKIDRSLVMTIDLMTPNFSAHDVAIQPHMSHAWSASVAEVIDIPPRSRRIHDRLLEAITMPTAFAMLMEQQTPIAYGLAVAESDTLGLFDIVVAPTARRRGAATSLTTALLNWGQAQGAMHAYLQIVADNETAAALYRKLGFKEQFQYHYRIRSLSVL